MVDRYEELRAELVGLLEAHELTDSDRKSLCELARTERWEGSHDWAYATGAISRVLDVIDTAGREGITDQTIRHSAVHDLKAILEQHTCEPN